MINFNKIILHREYNGDPASFYDHRTGPRNPMELLSEEEFSRISLIIDNMNALSTENYSDEQTNKMKKEIDDLKEYFTENTFRFLTEDLNNYNDLFIFTHLRFKKSRSNTIQLLNRFKDQGLIELELIHNIEDQDDLISSNINAYKRDFIFLISGILMILCSMFFSQYSKFIGYLFFPGVLIIIMSFSLIKGTRISLDKIEYIKK